MPKEFNETKQLAELSKNMKAAAVISGLNLRPLPSNGGKSMAELIAEEDTQLEERNNFIGKPYLVPVDLIDESPYQTSKLSEEKVIELSNNLATNPLSSPIVLRRKGLHRLELIAGRHRLAAYKRLQRNQIEATIRELDDEQAEKSVFYDNLFGPDLSDYEKYLGFSQRKKNKNLTQEQLAQEAGVSQSMISKLMSFDGLPDEVSAAMQQNPKTIGVVYASEFVRLSKERPDLAVQAIQRIACNEFTQKSAMAWIKKGGLENLVLNKPESDAIDQSIKSGRNNYAKMSLQKNRLSITFSNDDEGIEVWSIIEKVLKERAAALKAKD